MSDLRPEIDELLGAFALDAVDADERRIVEAYLALDPRARAEVAEHREVASLLAFTGAGAPEGLWDRIAGALDATGEPPPAPVLPLPLGRPRRVRRTAAVLGVAAAILVGMAGGVLITRDRGSGASNESALVRDFGEAMADPNSHHTRLESPDGNLKAEVVVRDDGSGYLAAGALPALSADRTYQLWGVLSGKVISLGVLGAHPGYVAFAADEVPSALVITEEDHGGVPVSKQPAALKGTLG